MKQKRIIPGFNLTMTLTVTMLILFILLPLGSVLSYALSLGIGEFFHVVMKKTVLYALAVSVGFSFLAAVINTVFGLIIAWVLVRYDFKGKEILDGMIELPFALPTAVAGITLSKLYSTTGFLGKPLSALGIRVSYTHLGILVSLIFIGIPFVVRSVQPVLKQLNPVYEEAAYTLGAKKSEIFRRVILPELTPPLLAGFGLAFARGIGEYGSVIYIAGNSARDHTQVISYVIMQKLNYMDYPSATAIAFVTLVISFLLLLFINIMQFYQVKRTSGGYEISYVRAEKSYENEEGGRRTRIALITISLLFFLFMLVIPLVSMLVQALSKGVGFYVSSLTTEYVKSAFGVTLLTMIITLTVNTAFGLIAAWLLTRYEFRGRRLLTTLIDIPFSISPVIAGLSYIMMFGRMGWFYPIIDKINMTFGTDIRIVYALPGVVLATIFVTFPFISREVIPILNSVGTDEEEAAALMGAGGFHIFKRITLPHIKWSLLYGMILCMARALGEFGAVNALSKTRGKTFTLPLEIDALYLAGDADSIVSAFAVSSILVIMAVFVLVIRQIFEKKYKEKQVKA